jgi:hypothetical protein
MDVRGGIGATHNGAVVQQWQCLGPAQTNQQWYLEETGDGWSYYVVAAHSKSCLTVQDGSVVPGAPLVQWTCLRDVWSHQRWALTPAHAYGAFELRAAHSWQCADVTGGPLAGGDGVPLQQWPCIAGNQSNQWWYITAP